MAKNKGDYADATRDPKAFIKHSREFCKPYRVTGGKKFRLKDYDPGDTGDLVHEDKPQAKRALAEGVLALADLQDRLYAQDQWSLLLIFQAMDAAGKDSAIKHVMSGVNPQGCQVHSFKQPTSDMTWSTTISGAPPAACPAAATSASSTAPIMRRSSWCACIRRFWKTRSCRRSW